MKTFVALIALAAIAAAEPQFGFSPFRTQGNGDFLPYAGGSSGFYNPGFYQQQQQPFSHFPYGRYPVQQQQQQPYLPYQPYQVQPVASAPAKPLKLVTYESSGAIVPEDTPAVMAAKAAHMQHFQAAASPYQARPFYYHPQQVQHQRLAKREAEPQYLPQQAPFTGYQQQQLPFHYQPYGAPWAQHAYSPYHYQPRFPMSYAQGGHPAYYGQYQQQMPFYQSYQGYLPQAEHKIAKRDAEQTQQMAPLSYNQLPYNVYNPFFNPARATPFQPQVYGSSPLAYRSSFCGVGLACGPTAALRPYGGHFAGFPFNAFA